MRLFVAFAMALALAGCHSGKGGAESAAKVTEVIVQHAGGSGIAFLWEQQLLNTPVPKKAG